MEEMLRVQKQQNVTIQKLKAANEELVAEKEELKSTVLMQAIMITKRRFVHVRTNISENNIIQCLTFIAQTRVYWTKYGRINWPMNKRC